VSATAEAPAGLHIDAATRAAVAELCRRFQVLRLDIFGSAVRADFDPARSDVDLVVTFDDTWKAHYADTYFGFLSALEDLFGRKVDLLTDRSIKNPYLRQTIDAERQPLFAAK